MAWEDSNSVNQKANFLRYHLRAKAEGYFTMPVDCPAAGKLHVLYVCRGIKIPPNSKIIKIIRYRDDQPAFTLLEFSSSNILTAQPNNLKFMDKYGIIDDLDNSYWKEETEIH